MRRLLLILLICLLVAPAWEAQGAKRKKRRAPAKTEQTQPARTQRAVKQERNTNTNEIKQTQARLKENKRQVAQNMNRLGEVNAEIDRQNAAINTLGDSIRLLNASIQTANDSISTLEKKVSTLQAAYAESLRAQRRRRRAVDDLTFVFSAQTFSQAASRMRYLRQLNTQASRRATELKAATQQLQGQRQQLVGLRQQHQSAHQQLAQARTALQQQQAKTTEIVNQLRSDQSALQEYLAERQRIGRQLDSELAKIVAQEEAQRRREAEEKARTQREAEEKARAQKAAEEKAAREQARAQQTTTTKGKQQPKQETAKKSSPSQPKVQKEQTTNKNQGPKTPPKVKDRAPNYDQQQVALTGSFESNKGRLPFPVTGSYKILSKFGIVPHPTNPKAKINNRGIDILAQPGAQARAIYDGEVAEVMRLSDFGTYAVLVRHGGYIAVYSGIATPSVRKGSKVRASQNLGAIYTDPDQTNSTQLHFELHRARPLTQLDPLLWVRR